MDATQPRIGVFFCDCGETVGNLIDLERLEEHARSLENVEYVGTDRFMCSTDATGQMCRVVRERKLDRLVIGACSPRVYGEEFRQAAEGAGINPYMVEVANLREQVAWMHSTNIGEATGKAKDAISMAVARSKELRPLTRRPTAFVIENRCSGCGVCASTCRRGAIVFKEGPWTGKRVAQVDSAECLACGACVAACPSGALDMEGFSNAEIMAEIDAFSEGLIDSKAPFPSILVFACNWCSYPAADLAGLKRMQMEPKFRIIRTPCSARVDPEWILLALSKGVDGVLVLGGKEGHCHYEGGNIKTKTRMALLSKAGRLRHRSLSSRLGEQRRAGSVPRHR
jgi:ferredoxin